MAYYGQFANIWVDDLRVPPQPKKERPHADLIKKWADNPDAEVYYWSESSGGWCLKKAPSWLPDTKYSVVLSQHKKLWQAFLDGDLQARIPRAMILTSWYDYTLKTVPDFDDPGVEFRVKPKKNFRFCEGSGGGPVRIFEGSDAVIVDKPNGDVTITIHK